MPVHLLWMWGARAGSVCCNLLGWAPVVASQHVDPEQESHNVQCNQKGDDGAVAQESVLVVCLQAAL